MLLHKHHLRSLLIHMSQNQNLDTRKMSNSSEMWVILLWYQIISTPTSWEGLSQCHFQLVFLSLCLSRRYVVYTLMKLLHARESLHFNTLFKLLLPTEKKSHCCLQSSVFYCYAKYSHCCDGNFCLATATSSLFTLLLCLEICNKDLEILNPVGPNCHVMFVAVINVETIQ